MSARPPKQNRHRSVQAVGTPPDFLAAFENRFGKIQWDLAADADLHVCDNFLTADDDALSYDWAGVLESTSADVAWINPPFADPLPWVRNAAATHLQPGQVIAVLTPAAVSTNWFAAHVHGKARVYFLSPRIKFVGHKSGFPKDLILSVYGQAPGYETWRWR